MATAPITAIKRDAEQASVLYQSNLKHIEEKFEVAKKDAKEAPDKIHQSLQQVNQVASSNDKEINFLKGRAVYLRRVIITNRNDSKLFVRELENIRQEKLKHKDIYKKDLQQQKSEQQEMENDLNTRISASIHQLKGLRFLQDIREQLEVQTISVNKLIDEEKQLNSDDMTSIRHQILDQREYYENDLKTRLAAARRFAKEFSDLHVDLVITKIRNETAENRKKLNEVSAKQIELLRENDALRKKFNVLNSKHTILQATVQSLQSDFNTLNTSIVDYEKNFFDAIDGNKNRLRQFLDERDDTIGELKLRKEEALLRRKELDQELLIVKRELEKLETMRPDSSQQEYEILDDLSQSATFILTAIDKSIDEQMIQEAGQISPQKKSTNLRNKSSPRNLKYTKPKRGTVQKSDLSKLMLKLQFISKQMKDGDLQVRSSRGSSRGSSRRSSRQSIVIKKDAETQTEEITETDSLSETIQPPSILEKTLNPRRNGSVPLTRKVPPFAYKTLFEQRTSRVQSPRNRVSITRPVHL
ncbi:hypothetical protein M9Y10_017491 [Tritrichomonas musculus]|uniref:Uncharacterized protein n=1 Tax=Tritrichomonas musculus TaxID=1915356 RepID=A0ABR2HTY2_9EUKA